MSSLEQDQRPYPPHAPDFVPELPDPREWQKAAEPPSEDTADAPTHCEAPKPLERAGGIMRWKIASTLTLPATETPFVPPLEIAKTHTLEYPEMPNVETAPLPRPEILPAGHEIITVGGYRMYAEAYFTNYAVHITGGHVQWAEKNLTPPEKEELVYLLRSLGEDPEGRLTGIVESVRHAIGFRGRGVRAFLDALRRQMPSREDQQRRTVNALEGLLELWAPRFAERKELTPLAHLQLPAHARELEQQILPLLAAEPQYALLLERGHALLEKLREMEREYPDAMAQTQVADPVVQLQGILRGLQTLDTEADTGRNFHGVLLLMERWVPAFVNDIQAVYGGADWLALKEQARQRRTLTLTILHLLQKRLETKHQQSRVAALCKMLDKLHVR